MKCRTAEPEAAVTGTGITRAARSLAGAGCAMHVVDEARGAGRRLATRRVGWLDPQGRRRRARFNQGVPALTASSVDFRQLRASTFQPDALVQWGPTLATGSRPLDDAGPLGLPQPDKAVLCRALLRDIPTFWSFAVDRQRHGPLVAGPGRCSAWAKQA